MLKNFMGYRLDLFQNVFTFIVRSNFYNLIHFFYFLFLPTYAILISEDSRTIFNIQYIKFVFI